MRVLTRHKKRLKETISPIPNISIERNFIFVHVPKNAGTTIYKNLGLPFSGHRTVSQYQQILGNELYDKMFSFAFVRNPFDRFLSLYNYARMEVSYYHNNIEPEKGMYGEHLDYQKLKNATIDDAVKLLLRGELNHNPPHVQWNPQRFWLTDSSGDLNIKYLGKFEDLDFHIRNIASLIGDKTFGRNLKRNNKSSSVKTDYRQLIGSDARSVLEQYYREDLETFNYCF